MGQERPAAPGLNPGAVLKQLAKVPVSLHCWQDDGACGLENFAGASSGAADGFAALRHPVQD